MFRYSLIPLILMAIYFIFLGELSAQVNLPGTDPSTQLDSAGSLLKLVDTALFTWGARLLAGLCILSAGWSLKEQRFGIAFLCILAAVVIGTAPMWVTNIFSIGGGGIFSSNQIHIDSSYV